MHPVCRLILVSVLDKPHDDLLSKLVIGRADNFALIHAPVEFSTVDR